jgi:hypothetical protein
MFRIEDASDKERMNLLEHRYKIEDYSYARQQAVQNKGFVDGIREEDYILKEVRKEYLNRGRNNRNTFQMPPLNQVGNEFRQNNGGFDGFDNNRAIPFIP